MKAKTHIFVFRACVFLLQIVLSLQVHGQNPKTGLSVAGGNKGQAFKPIVAIEAWATHSKGEQKEESVYAERNDVSFRRFRFGASGKPYGWMTYNFQLHMDRLGEDSYASTKGSFGGLGIWNALISAKLLRNSELLNLHVGYFLAAVSREFNTSSWAVGSYDKTRADWYMRSFVTGAGNGIESGIGLGGIKNYSNFGISYRIGIYEPRAYLSSQYNTSLYTGRIMFSIGDPEQSSYKYTLSGNQWHKRNGITLGLGGSTQSNGCIHDTTFFEQSIAYGADLLINYLGLRIDGQYYLFSRNAIGVEDFMGRQWHFRIGYSFVVSNKYFEPVFTYECYKGFGNEDLFKHIGTDYTLDAGLNYYLDKDKLKIAVHYVVQKGSVSSNIGDYLGVALQFRI